MNNVFILRLLIRKLYWVVYFLSIVAASALENTTVNTPTIDCICQDVSGLPAEAFFQLYSDLEKAVFENPLNEGLRKFRKPFLEHLFLSFKDVKAVHSGQSIPLLKVLVQKIAPFMLAPLEEESLKRQIEINSLAWQDFKAFLTFYALNTKEYNSLPTVEQRKVIDNLHVKYEGML
jgi:hypothetical protein